MITPGQVAVSGTVALVTVPPGPSSVVLSAAGTIYVGDSTAVTTANGAAVTSSPVTLAAYPGSSGTTLYATCAGTVAAFCWLVTSR